MSDLQPRTIAAAIADLAEPQVREAWLYRDRCQALARAGVPEAELLRVLATTYTPAGVAPVELRQTQAMGLLRQHTKGLVGLVGDYDSGKTFAALVWVLDRHDAGRSSVFVEFAGWGSRPRAERDRQLERAASADGLVLDDVGAGLSKGETVRELWEGVLLQRLARGRPTIVLANTTKAEVEDWLGGRVLSRLEFGGGVDEVSGEPMRELELDDPRYAHASKLVEAFGCERDFGTETLTVGRRLDAEARRLGHPACKAARLIAGLSQADVKARAEEIEATEANHSQRLATSVAAIMSKNVVDNDRRADECRAAMNAPRRSTGEPNPTTILPRGQGAPAWARGDDGRAKLRALGYRVRPSKLGGVNLVRLRAPDQVGDGERKFALVALADTEHAAWETAGRLCGLRLGLMDDEHTQQ